MNGRFYGPIGANGRIMAVTAQEVGSPFWRVYQADLEIPFFYQNPDGVCIISPHMTKTDLGSIPRPLWPIFPPHRNICSYLPHDQSYYEGIGFVPRSEGEILGDRHFKDLRRYVITENVLERRRKMLMNWRLVKLTRADSDRGLLHCMAHEGVTKPKRVIIYRFVRTFGFIPWHKKQLRHQDWLVDNPQLVSALTMNEAMV